jgi:hypothetical protein
MSIRVIAMVFAFATATVVGGLAYHYGPDLLRDDTGQRERLAVEAEALPLPAI